MPTEPDLSQNVGAEVLLIMPSFSLLLPRPSSFNLSPAPEPPTGSKRAHTVGPQGKREVWEAGLRAVGPWIPAKLLRTPTLGFPCLFPASRGPELMLGWSFGL